MYKSFISGKKDHLELYCRNTSPNTTDDTGVSTSPHSLYAMNMKGIIGTLKIDEFTLFQLTIISDHRIDPPFMLVTVNDRFSGKMVRPFLSSKAIVSSKPVNKTS